MDFKVAGTEQGVTALQMDIKIQGITKEIMQVALNRRKEGRLHILSLMKQGLQSPGRDLPTRHACSSSRSSRRRSATSSAKAGAVIRAITEETGYNDRYAETVP